MKHYCIGLAIFIAVSAGSAAEAKQKSFMLVVDPPDARIRLTFGSGLKGQEYSSPARISVSMPDRDEKKKIAVEITRDGYEPKSLPVQDILGDQTLKVALKKIRARLKFQMIAPEKSSDLRIKNNDAILSLRINEQQLEMSLLNKSAHPIKVLWERASYQDMDSQSHRLMHKGIPYEDRNRVLPSQQIMPYMTLNQIIFPVDQVRFNVQKKLYEPASLFPLQDPGRLKGKNLELFIPVEINSTIVPFRFKIKVDVIRE
jgi:hypothetical protein